MIWRYCIELLVKVNNLLQKEHLYLVSIDCSKSPQIILKRTFTFEPHSQVLLI